VVCAERFRVPIWAHAETARLLAGKVAIDRFIEDGEGLELEGPDREPWRLLAIHTPGHAPGHLAFYDERYRHLFAGDMVSTQTSMVIVPPEGNLTDYVQSLDRLRKFAGRLLLPAHGGPTARSLQAIDDAIEHRLVREKMLLDALRAGPRTVADLTTEIYKGVPEKLIKFARYQVIAGLEKLQRECRAEMINPDFWSIPER
jgi:glyoxylase-like metal-dependent hydrolase (beta-lactamase superfamily II)